MWHGIGTIRIDRVAIVVGLVVLFGIGSAKAQQFGKGGGAAGGKQRVQSPAEMYAALKPTKIAGAIKSVQNNVITVTMKDSKEVVVQPPPAGLGTLSIVITGRAELAALTPGMLVEFTGKVNKKGEFDGVLESLTVRESSDTSVKRGVFAVPDGDSATGSAAAETPAKLSEESEERFIRAPVKSVKEDLITVLAPGAPPIQAKVSPGAKITLAFRSPGLAQNGDGIKIEGKLSTDGSQVYAEKIQINLTNPLEPKKKPGAKSEPASLGTFK